MNYDLQQYVSTHKDHHQAVFKPYLSCRT